MSESAWDIFTRTWASKDGQELSRQERTGRRTWQLGGKGGDGRERGEGLCYFHVCAMEPSTGCLEELNTVFTPEAGVWAAMTKSSGTCRKWQVSSA